VTWSYRPALDGLRSVAVYLVLLFHSGMTAFAGGFIGVDLFFVLSGFLVSNVILSEIRETGRLSLGRFYARRVRRLLPAAVVTVAATSLVFLIVFPVVRRLPLVLDAQSALLYVANWNFLVRSNDYFASDVDKSPFLHFWSLSIEEQFYVFFPILLLLLSRLRRRRSAVMLAVLGGLLLLSLAAQLYWARVNMNWAYYGTDARLYQLLAGALLAVALLTFSRRPPAAVSAGIAVLGLLGMLGLGSGLLELAPSPRGILATVASVALIGGLMTSEGSPLARVLSHGMPVYLGKVSYGTYLWHWPVILVLQDFLATRPVVTAALAMAISTGLASLSFELLELPVRTAAVLRRFRWSTVVVGVATSALVATAVVPPVLESQRRPRLAQPGGTAFAAENVTAGAGAVGAKERNKPVPQDIDWRSMLGHPEDEPLCTVRHPVACTLVRGSGPHIVLVGDSQARALTPMFRALAKKHGFTFSHNAVPACPWQSEVVLERLPESRLKECLAQRDEWYDQVLPQLHADLVVLLSMPRGEGDDPKAGRSGPPLTRVGGSDESVAELLFSTTRDTVRQIESTGPRVLIVESLPIPGHGDPLECLARASRLRQCEVPLPAEQSMNDVFAKVAAELSDDVFTVDLDPVFCYGRPRCLPVIDGTVVWSDAHHLSVAITQKKREEVWRAIKATGALDGLGRS
jgi:peptidoglycan/LPS O-acetylase OafA/YrhL